ncbi:20778_t:CDS:2, partial [Entrophospora sp. SA101]
GIRDIAHIITIDNGSNINKDHNILDDPVLQLVVDEILSIIKLLDVPTWWDSIYLAWMRFIKIKEFILLLASFMEFEYDTNGNF